MVAQLCDVQVPKTLATFDSTAELAAGLDLTLLPEKVVVKPENGWSSYGVLLLDRGVDVGGLSKVSAQGEPFHAAKYGRKLCDALHRAPSDHKLPMSRNQVFQGPYDPDRGCNIPFLVEEVRPPETCA